jgi:DNA polymerase-4
MASIDEAYLDMTGSERILGPPLKAAHDLHQAVKAATELNCSVGIATSRLVAKIGSDQAKPNGIIWILPGAEARFLSPLPIRKIPGVGKVTEKSLKQLGVESVGDLTRFEEGFLERRFGKWGLALAGKARGEDAGGWFDTEVGADTDPKSISHEHTYNEDTADVEVLEATLARLSEMVGRRLREHGLHARNVQLKLRYADFSAITRAHTLAEPTQLDIELFENSRALLRANWKPGSKVRLLGVQASSFDIAGGQMDLLEDDRRHRWKAALEATDRLRDKYGETAVSLAKALRGSFAERTHENPVGLPGKKRGR